MQGFVLLFVILHRRLFKQSLIFLFFTLPQIGFNYAINTVITRALITAPARILAIATAMFLSLATLPISSAGAMQKYAKFAA